MRTAVLDLGEDTLGQKGRSRGRERGRRGQRCRCGQTVPTHAETVIVAILRAVAERDLDQETQPLLRVGFKSRRSAGDRQEGKRAGIARR